MDFVEEVMKFFRRGKKIVIKLGASTLMIKLGSKIIKIINRF